VQVDACAVSTPGGLLEQACGPYRQVLCWQHIGGVRIVYIDAGNVCRLQAFDVQRVVPIQQHEHRLHQVITVCTPPGDV
jgi:hypothetical protein